VVQSQTLQLWRSSIVRKFIMGLSGLALSGFVLAHMTGNLLIFKGAEAYNMYGHAMTHNPAYPLIAWGLVAVILVHILCAISLTWENQRARDHRYAMGTHHEKGVSLASKTMAATGSLLAVFIVLHLISFKYGAHYEATYNGVVVRDLHRLLVEVFQKPGYVVWYLVSLVLLGFHLSHGFAAAFQSVGFSHPRWNPLVKTLAYIYAIVVAVGFISQPIYVYFFAARS
jgi:succinate dehydrogenase / fumarate reductase cytochrome b subunit